jgi:uncharacterized protein (DUF305 family)
VGSDPLKEILMFPTRSVLVALTALAFSSGVALAQHAGHGSHADHASPGAAAPASAAAAGYRAANDKMHKDMDIAFTGDADADFLRGMIPHHQGAIDMARVALAHGKDPKVRKLAEDVIRAQEAEIKMMQEWLAAKK